MIINCSVFPPFHLLKYSYLQQIQYIHTIWFIYTCLRMDCRNFYVSVLFVTEKPITVEIIILTSSLKHLIQHKIEWLSMEPRLNVITNIMIITNSSYGNHLSGCHNQQQDVFASTSKLFHWKGANCGGALFLVQQFRSDLGSNIPFFSWKSAEIALQAGR